MPRYDRGGLVLKTGKIGRMNILRQQMLLPGERLNCRIPNGEIRLTALRERESTRIHARLDAFATPIRWLWSDWPAYIKEGPATTKTLPTKTHWGSRLAVGGDGGNRPIFKPFFDAPLRIYNEWYKWPEDNDITDIGADGPACVNLPMAWTRLQKNDGPQAADRELVTTASSSREKFDIRDLSELQARYRNAIERDWIGHDRYMEIMQELWNAGGSREVDKVPIRIGGADLTSGPRNVYATDSAGLGSVMSLYNFGVNHNFGMVSFPEHMILTYILVLRFDPVAEDEQNPLSQVADMEWHDIVGDPGMLASERPRNVKRRELADTSSSTALGYLPAGWQWRSRWNHVGTRVDARNTYPVLKTISLSTTAAKLRDATQINPAFRSTALGDYSVNLVFDEMSDSPIPGPKSSLYAGAPLAGRGSSYPYPGPRRVV